MMRAAATTLRRRCAAEGGVTLVELMVVTGLLAVTGAIVAAGVISAMQVTRHAGNRVEALTDIHNTIANVTREVRAADSRSTLRPAAESDAALLAAAPTLLETDVLRGGTRIRFTYEVDAGALTERRRVWNDPGDDPATTAPTSERTRVLMDSLQNTADQPLFGFRRGDGTCVTGCTAPDGTPVTAAATGPALASIREVTLTVRRDIGEGRTPIAVETRVLLRNS